MLYKHFNCNTKEELYKKIKENHNDVKSLIDFINYAKCNIANNDKPISSSDDFVNILNKLDELKKDEIEIIFTDAKNRPIHFNKMKFDNIDFKNIIQLSSSAPINSAFLIYDESINYKVINDLKENLNLFGIRINDSAKYLRNIKSVILQENKALYALNEENSASLNIGNKKMNYSQYKEFDDFISYYSENEIKNLDIYSQYEEIKMLLKLNYQQHTTESFGFLAYDENDKVYLIKELFKGGKSESIVDNLALFKNIISDEKLKGFIVFHNHPSGNTMESQEDIKITLRILKTSELLNIPCYDHLIIGYENVKSFREEVPKIYFSDMNDAEKEKLDAIKILKKNKYYLDFLENPLLCNDKSFIKIAIQNIHNNYVSKIVHSIDENIKNDREIAKEILKKDGCLIEEIKCAVDDEELSLIAMKQNSLAIIYMKKEFQEKFKNFSSEEIDEYLYKQKNENYISLSDIENSVYERNDYDIELDL